MRCAPRHPPERAGRGYQRAAVRPPPLSTGRPAAPSCAPRTCDAAAVPKRDDGRGRLSRQRRARDAWWVRTRAAVTAASATTAARAAAGSVCAGVADEASD